MRKALNISLNTFILVGALLSLSMGLSNCSPKSQNDCGFVQNIYGQRISWKNSGAIRLFIHDSVPTELRPAIYRAAATWEKEVGFKIFDITEDSTQLGPSHIAPSRDQKNAIYFLSEWESDRTSEQGRTSVYWVGDQIQEADIRINAFDFSYYDQDPQHLIGGSKKSNRLVSDGYSFEALILHEMGHFLGLKHREDGSVMATHLASNSNRTQLAAVDLESISCEYKQ